MGARVLLCMVLLYAGCTSRGRYVILGNIEEPQHIIADTISSILNRYLDDTVVLMEGMGNQHNFNRLMVGDAHFAVVDNYTTTEAGVQVVLPLYPQVLHVVHKGYYHPRTLKELLEGKKVFAGLEGSGAWKFVQRLLQDYGIHANQIEFVSVYEIFDADVTFHLPTCSVMRNCVIWKATPCLVLTHLKCWEGAPS